MKKILYLFISVILFASCVNKMDEPIDREPSSRTVLVYMLSSNLSTSLKKNVIDMFDGLQNSTHASNILIYWDNKDNALEYPSIIKLSSDGYGNVNGVSKVQYATEQKTLDKFSLIIKYSRILKTYLKDQNPIDKDVITQILKDMINFSPSTSYGLIFGSHAESWLPSSRANRYSRAFASVYGDGIDIPDLNEALLKVVQSTKKFEYILMDACMMGNIEVAYELQNTCNYYIASPMEVPGDGFPYSDIIPYLFSDDYRDYTRNLCDAYCYYHTQKNNWGNCVALDCSAFADFTFELKKNIDNFSSTDLSLIQHYYKDNSTSYDGLSYDILDFVNKITNNKPSSSFVSQLNKLVVGKAFSNSTTSDYPSFKNVDTSTLCGLGMYIPISTKINWNSYLKNSLMWGKTSGWKEYMEKNNFTTN